MASHMWDILVATAFLRDYAAGMFALLIQNGGGDPLRLHLAQGVTTIGRNTENNIVLTDASVSGSHAEIIAGEGRTTLRDLNSSNGTRVNGDMITEIDLSNGDEIVFGSVVCRTETAQMSEIPQTLLPDTTSTPEEKSAARVSFWSKFLDFCKAASQETRRAVHIAVAKVKIERLKRFDLSNAHYKLGKQCYEMRLKEEVFAAERAAISELERQIKEKRESNTGEDDPKNTGDKIKRLLRKVKLSAEIKRLSMKRNQLLTSLGQQMDQSATTCTEATEESDNVKGIQESIQKLQDEIASKTASSLVNKRWLVASCIIASFAMAGILYSHYFATNQVTNAEANKQRVEAENARRETEEWGVLTTKARAERQRKLVEIQRAKEQKLSDLKPLTKKLEAEVAQGSTEAKVKLGMIYAELNDFNFIEKSKGSAECIYKAAEQNCIKAQSILGKMYLYGVGFPQNLAEAVKWLRKAAEQGDSDAQVSLTAQILSYYVDRVEQHKWDRKAVENGNVDALLGDASTLVQSKKPERIAEGIKLLRKLADLDHPSSTALSLLGNIYDQDEYVPKDVVLAYLYHNLAVTYGDSSSAKSCEKLEMSMKSTQISEALRLSSERKPSNTPLKKVVPTSSGIAVTDKDSILKVKDDAKNSLGMKFVPVPGTGVLFSVWETRVKDYAAFAVATGRKVEKPDFEQTGEHPVVNVSWEDAKAFCVWLSKKEGRAYRLPSDEEWSAAVGLPKEVGITPKDKTEKVAGYPWGAAWPPPKGAGNYGEGVQALMVDDYENTSPVGSFAANALGIYDLGGNVWEWCEDWYDNTRRDRVLRGGSWLDDEPVLLRSSFRRGDDPIIQDGIRGFRVVLVVPVAK